MKVHASTLCKVTAMVSFFAHFLASSSGLSVDEDSQPRSPISVAGDAEMRFFKSEWMR